MPYYPLDFDAKKKIPKVARAAGIEPGEVAWGLFEVWEHVFLTKSPEVGELVLDGCFGPNPKLREALVAYEFLEPVDGRFRVRGSKRLIGVSGQPAAAGTARASGAQRDQRGRFQPSSATSGHPAPAGQPLDSHTSENPALTPSTKHQAPSTKKKAEAASDEQAPGPQVRAPAAEVVTEPTFKRPVGDIVATVEALYREATGEAFAWDAHPNGPEERALRALEAAHGERLPELLRVAFEPSWPAHASLARLHRGGAGAINELRQKAARLKAAKPAALTVGRAADPPSAEPCPACGERPREAEWQAAWLCYPCGADATLNDGVNTTEAMTKWVEARRQERAA